MSDNFYFLWFFLAKILSSKKHLSLFMYFFLLKKKIPFLLIIWFFEYKFIMIWKTILNKKENKICLDNFYVTMWENNE